MSPPQVYACFSSWTPLPPPSLHHPSGSSQCTSPEHPISYIEPGLAIHFLYDIIHVSIPFSQIIPPSPSPTESKRLFYTSVSLLLSRIQGYCYHLSKFHIYALAYCTEWSKPDRQTFLNGTILREKVLFPSSSIAPGTLTILNEWMSEGKKGKRKELCLKRYLAI